MLPGEIIDDRFEIERLAGSGGMGCVYRAIDRRSGEPVALKVLLHAQGSPDLRRFEREAEVLAALRLPGIVKYVAHGSADGQPYLAMEWLTGELLSTRLAERPLPVAESVALAERLATTLGRLHQQGIVHRDVKPSNIMLLDGGGGEGFGAEGAARRPGTPNVDRATLLDFGVVRLGAVGGTLTGTDAVLGTPGYMAPEQARGARAVDARADVFALGCVLYKCLTGFAPFQGGNALAVLAKVLIEDPPRVSALRSDVPPALDALVARMLSKSPDDRPRDGAAVAAELGALAKVADGAASVRPSTPLAATAEITSGERKVMCLVLTREPASDADETWREAEAPARGQELRALALRYRGQVELVDGRLPLVVLADALAPTDLALRAGDQIRAAWEEFLQAECAVKPVLLVLEDLHWGDLPTVTMVEQALRNLRDSPFLVLALSRPEVRELFPKLWERHLAHDMQLLPLTRRASERIVRGSLGPEVAEELVAKLVERGQGNAFYLQELIRVAADGRANDVPETVLAMVQAGFEVFDADVRRALRAASIFGERFTARGVAALVGGASVEPLLRLLEQREIIAPERTGAPPGDRAYRFRHALVREAAYGMLTDRDRQLGHVLAGEWLARSVEGDPMAEAEHFERGEQPERAAAAFLRAAEQALCGSDLGAAIARAERGALCSTDPATVGALRLLQAEAHRWRGEYAAAEQRAVEAAERLAPGSSGWFQAVNEIQIAGFRLGGVARLAAWLTAAEETPALPGALMAKNSCLADAAFRMCFRGELAGAKATVDAVERSAAEAQAHDLSVSARLHEVRATWAAMRGDPATLLEQREKAVGAFEQVGDHRNACRARINLCCAYSQPGAFEAAEAGLRLSLAEAERLGMQDTVALALHNLGFALWGTGKLPEAREAEAKAVAMFQRFVHQRMEGAGCIYLTRILLSAGDPNAAELSARERAADELRASAAHPCLGRPRASPVLAREDGRSARGGARGDGHPRGRWRRRRGVADSPRPCRGAPHSRYGGRGPRRHRPGARRAARARRQAPRSDLARALPRQRAR